ncbi:MAG: DUF4908 domain-containing protein [Alphaproteobacteria bacterium]|nr:DUF4908 domain-containing protein [Alphaproteobacteria bacterium]MBU1514578.1 DUF4908 domain-containing protein [Alphaproteobacteria bacterium]MBU2096790.1 DUF4908 domain-containing protein [Alphaproteobacteria bacterium]MBU2152486.1 DUF4908 domain-containing protein [Alphaproteobacteria bacterium]MBU2306577.1 DUF4908 domain-containing protein [Alphaproteobacteria bacterium]
MTGELTASRGVFSAALLGAVLFGLALPAQAGPVERLREGLFKNRGAESAGPAIARYVSEEGRVFILDRTQPVPMLKFEDSPEVWVLAPNPAPRGDVIYKNDLGEPMLRATRLGGFTLFTDERPSGEAVSLAGGGSPLRLPAMSPQAVFERLAQASLRASRAARRPMLFEAEATPGSSALIADAAVVTSVAIIRLSQRKDGRALLAQFNRVRFMEGKKSQATLKNGILTVVVAPTQGLAGRPSSDRIIKVARGK